MGDVSKAIQKYINENIKLSQPDISRSARSRDWLLGRISSVISNRRNEPSLYSDKPYLNFGSYVKQTKVQVVDEYDIMVTLDSAGGSYTHNGATIGHGQGNLIILNPLFNDRFLKTDRTGVSPTKILNWLKGVVKEVLDPHGGDPPVRNGQAIVAHINNTDTTFDLVPAAILKRVSDNKIFYAIPKGDQADNWLATAPEDDIKAVETAADGRTNFRNVTRICKRIKDTYNFKVSSFAIETAMVSYTYAESWYQNLYVDVRGALTHLAQKFRDGTITDPFSANNLICGVESLSWYADRLDGIKKVLDDCIALDDQAKVNEKVRKSFENE